MSQGTHVHEWQYGEPKYSFDLRSKSESWKVFRFCVVCLEGGGSFSTPKTKEECCEKCKYSCLQGSCICGDCPIKYLCECHTPQPSKEGGCTCEYPLYITSHTNTTRKCTDCGGLAIPLRKREEHPTPPPEQTPEWEEIADEMMSHLNWISCTCCQRYKYKIKPLIHALLSTERERTLEALKLWRPIFYRDKVTEEDIKELPEITKQQ